MPPPYRPKKGYTLPGYNYLGPFNDADAGQPVNALDELAQTHDQEYTALQEAGHNPYLYYNPADEKMLQATEKMDGALPAIVSAVWRTKRALTGPPTPDNDNENRDPNIPEGQPSPEKTDPQEPPAKKQKPEPTPTNQGVTPESSRLYKKLIVHQRQPFPSTTCPTYTVQLTLFGEKTTSNAFKKKPARAKRRKRACSA